MTYKIRLDFLFIILSRAMSHKYESFYELKLNKLRNTMKYHLLEISLRKISYFDPKFENYVKNRIALVHPSRVNGTSENVEVIVQ